MPATKTSTRELRKQAKALDIDGWEDMSAAQLKSAIAEVDGGDEPEEKPARRTSTRRASSSTAAKKSPARKTSTRSKSTTAAKTTKSSSVEVAENGNPFKPQTNLWYITEEIIKGGKRSAMVKRLKKKIDLKPRNASDDYDEDYEIDRRILITGQLLRRDHGFDVEREGRGPEDGTIFGTPS